MAGFFGTAWARYKTLIVFWFISLALIVAALLIQWWEADLSSRFTAVKNAEICPLQITVAYPTRLFLPSLNAPEQKLIIQVADTERTAYKISLAKADWFVLYDQDGNAISPYWEGTENAVFTAFVKAYPDQSAGAQNHRINLVEENGTSCLVDLDQIALESVGESRWRVGLGIFARNIALPLGLLSVIAGWAVSYFGKENEKAESEFREKLGKLSDEFDKDPLLALTQCLELRKYVQKKHLGTDGIEGLENAVSRLFRQEAIKRVVRQLGALAERGEEQKLLQFLEKILSFRNQFSSLDFDNKMGQFFSSLELIYGWLNKEVVKEVDVVAPIMFLWDNFDVFTVELVIYLLDRLLKKPRVRLRKKITEALEKTDHRKRLMRYKRLESVISVYYYSTLPLEYTLPYSGAIP